MKSSILLLFLVAVCPVSSVLAQSLPEPVLERIWAQDEKVLDARNQVRGSGVTFTPGITSRPAIDLFGNELYWKIRRDVLAPNRTRHVFYQQYFRGSGKLTEAAVLGGEIGLHYSPSGKLTLVAGGQYLTVRLSNYPAIARQNVQQVTLQKLAGRPGLRVRPFEALTVRQRVIRDENTTLFITSTAPSVFRYVYLTYVDDLSDKQYQVILDAKTSDVVAVNDTSLDVVNCDPTTPYTSAQATGVPVRSDVATRTLSLRANVASVRPGFTHEGFDQTSPLKLVYHETQNDAFQCVDLGYSFSLFPLNDVAGTPTYQDSGDWKGSAAGDALFHTDKTMVALSMMFWSSWNGAGADAKIEVEVGANNSSSFLFNHTANDRYPAGSTVLMGPAGSNRYSFAAALDAVAHEWGHGVVQTIRGWIPNSGIQGQLLEAFADVIGHSVEKRIQPAGSAVEQSSDWTILEDAAMVSGQYARGPIDDGEFGHWFGATHFNDTLHKDDEVLEQESHARGNMMNVVSMLLSDGGTNPICSRPDWAGTAACPSAMTGIQYTKATQILFDTVVYYAPSSNARWEDMADYASSAAFDRYNTCDINHLPAPAEQIAVNNAFTRIGYPRLNSARACGSL